MRIAIHPHPRPTTKTYDQHLYSLLKSHCHTHEYIATASPKSSFDLFHSSTHHIPTRVWLKGVPFVITIPNLHYINHSHLYSRWQRALVKETLRTKCRNASRIITTNTRTRSELIDLFNIDEDRVETLLPLGAQLPLESISSDKLRYISRKYDLPPRFILTIGNIGTAHHHDKLIESLFECSPDMGIVICGRHTRFVDNILHFARMHNRALSTQFIYEFDTEELAPLMSLATLYVSLVQSPASHIIEAMRAGTPMILSDLHSNEELAGDAALYVDPHQEGALTDSLNQLLSDKNLHDRVSKSASERSEEFSPRAFALRLSQIYNEL